MGSERGDGLLRSDLTPIWAIGADHFSPLQALWDHSRVALPQQGSKCKGSDNVKPDFLSSQKHKLMSHPFLEQVNT